MGKVTVKIIISLFWLFMWTTPIIVCAATDKFVLQVIGIVYGIVVWEMSKHYLASWVRKEWMQLFRGTMFDIEDME